MSSSAPPEGSAYPAPAPIHPSAAARFPAFVNPASPNVAAAREALEKCERFTIHDLVPAILPDQIRASVENGATRILIAGGDGTLRTAAAALLGTSTEMAVLPAGTLNHFAKDHGIPDAPDEAVQAALGADIERVDVGMVGDRLFLNTASVGLYVNYVRTRERLERFLGYRLASLAASLRTLIRPQMLSVELQLRGITKRYRTPLVFIGVGERELKAPVFGGRIDGGDRGLHVIVIRGHHPARLLATVLAATTRGVKEVAATPQLDSFIVESCVVNVGRRSSVPLALDGEVVRVTAPLEFRVKHDALRVVAARPPADEPAPEASEQR